MWEYELFLKYLNDAIKEENDENKKEMDKYNINDMKKMSNPSQFNKNFKMPNVNIPNMKV